MSRIVSNTSLVRDATGWPLDSLGYGSGGLGKTLSLPDTATHRVALPVAGDGTAFALFSLAAIGGNLHLRLGDVTVVATAADGGWDLYLASGQAVDDFLVRNIAGLAAVSTHIAAISDTGGASLKLAPRT